MSVSFLHQEKWAKKEHMCSNSAAMRKTTINLAGTHYAPIAVFAKIEEMPEKVRQKEKQQLTCAWDSPPIMV